MNASRLMHNPWRTSSGPLGRAKPVTPWNVCATAFTRPTSARDRPRRPIGRASPRRRVTSSTAQYTPKTMQGTTMAAGSAYQWASASSTASPQSRAAGAVTTITEIALSRRSIDRARPPDRARTMSTIEVMSSTAMAAITTVLSSVGARSPVEAPTTMAQPTPYIPTSAASHSHQQHWSGLGERRAANQVLTNAGVVYSPLARRANTTRYWLGVRARWAATATTGRESTAQMTNAHRSRPENTQAPLPWSSPLERRLGDTVASCAGVRPAADLAMILPLQPPLEWVTRAHRRHEYEQGAGACQPNGWST